jgi:MFS family permease
MTPDKDLKAEAEVVLIERRLSTPRAAAVAGILFAVLYSTALIILYLSVPRDSGAGDEWVATSTGSVSFALALVPFAGITFLWFMAVIRDRLGRHEDQFFATVFMGSGLLYMAMTFAAAAVLGGLIASYQVDQRALTIEVYNFGRTLTAHLTNIYAVRMAGVFMISSATMWVRTGVMPRPLALATYILALILLVTINLTVWITLLFPAWVFVVSLLVLVANYRRRSHSEPVA